MEKKAKRLGVSIESIEIHIKPTPTGFDMLYFDVIDSSMEAIPQLKSLMSYMDSMIFGAIDVDKIASPHIVAFIKKISNKYNIFPTDLRFAIQASNDKSFGLCLVINKIGTKPAIAYYSVNDIFTDI
jgi:hypothetical protein